MAPEPIEEGKRLAREYIDLLKDWIPRRRVTVRELRAIATALDEIESNVNIGKVAGTATAVAAGVGSLACLVLTGGLGAPFVIGGLIGTAASVTSDIVGNVMSKDRLKDAQKALDNEQEYVRKIENKKEQLDKIADSISKECGMSAENVLNTFLLTTVPSYNGTAGYSFDVSRILRHTMLVEGVICGGTLLGFTVIQYIRVMSVTTGKVLPKLSIIGVNRILSKVVGTALRGIAAGVLVIWDAFLLVRTINDIENGSGSKTATALRGLACKLEKQIGKVEDLLGTIRRTAIDLEKNILEEFRRLLLDISKNGRAAQKQMDDLGHFIELHASDAWRKSLTEVHLTVNEFARNQAFPLARIVDNLLQEIEKQTNKDEDKTKRKIITVLAHGNIDTSATFMFPCAFYYMMPSLEKITLYPPWGCAIDHTAAHGIITNTISMSNVQYSGEVRPYRPSDFNHLPNNFVRIPLTTFYPVVEDEQVMKNLFTLYAYYSSTIPDDVIFIPYYSKILPYPQIPLCVFAAGVALCGLFLNTSYKLRVACCLSVSDPRRETGFVDCNQYCVVDGNRTGEQLVCMRSNVFIPPTAQPHLNTLEKLL